VSLPTTVNDGTFISADYFLTRPVAGAWLDPTTFPARVLTLNEHVAPTLPSPEFLGGSEPWPGYRERQRLRVLDFFSIDRARLEDLRRWSVDPANADDVDWGPPYGSVGLEFVRETARRFLPVGTDAIVIGIAVAASDADAMARCFGVENDAPCEPRWLERRTPPEPGGQVVGFDPAPISRECPQRGCSWICEALEWEEVEREVGARLNEHGLLATYDEAFRASTWLRGLGDLCGGDRWFPWRISAYPLTA
jgi:hypothetical protein